MSRYRFRKPAAACTIEDGDPPMIPNIVVPDHEARFTGLLDSDGNEIWLEPRPIGFGRDDEW